MSTSQYSLVAAALILTGVVSVAGAGKPHTLPPSSAAEGAYLQLPLTFERGENSGREANRAAPFVTRGAGYAVYLQPTEAQLLTAPAASSTTVPHARPSSAGRISLRFAGANPEARLEPRDPVSGESHYLRGRDPRRWRTHVKQYARVEAEDVYPGIDLVYYGRQGRLEYDFVVAPGADPHAIRLEFSGARAATLDPSGNLILNTPGGEIRQQKPFVYQDLDGRRIEIPAHYVLADQAGPELSTFNLRPSTRNPEPSTRNPQPSTFNLQPLTSVRLALADYDRTRPLVIDPVLAFSTYLGGSGSDGAFSVAVDETGSAYVTGSTLSLDFPTAAPLQDELGGDGVRVDTFVAKLLPSGSGLVYSTYLGGNGNDFPHGIAVDAQGQVCVAGETDSTDFPTHNPYQEDLAGEGDTFISRLQADGAGFLFSTYLGGRGSDLNSGVALDGEGAVYVTGATGSNNFPVANAYQPQHAGGQYDAYVAKFDPTGATLAYSTYLGGTKQDFPGAFNSIAVDAEGGACVVGTTFSTNFPLTANAPDAVFGTDLTTTEIFVSRLAPGGEALTFSTYLGGSGSETGRAITVASFGEVAVTGYTRSADYPTVNALRASHGGGTQDAVVTKLNPAHGGVVFSTYLGGASNDLGEGIAADGGGNVYVTGETFSTDFPVAAPLQPNLGSFEAFVSKISSTGASLVYSTYLGGASQDTGIGIAVGASGTATVVGRTLSANFPLSRALQPDYEGSGDAFIARIVEGVAPPAVPSDLQALAPCGTQVTLVWTDNSDNEDAFEIERKTLSVGGNPVFLPVGAVEADVRLFEDRGLTPSTTYVYRVRATNRDGASPYSNEIQVTTHEHEPPNPPQDVAVEALSHNSLQVSWTDASAGETGFKIERSGETGGFTLIHTTAGDVTTFSDTGLNAATIYRYRVRSTNGGCDSVYSTVATGQTRDSPPVAPSGLTARGVSDTRIELSWTDNSDNETGFKIERRRGSNDPFTLLETVEADATTFADTNLQHSTTYTYRVRATSDSGDSAHAEANGTTLALARGKIKVARAVNFGKVALGTQKAKDLVISNISRNEVLRITVFPVVEPFGTISGGGETILIIGGRQRVALRFKPTKKGRFKANLVISSSDPARPSVTVKLSGIGK